MEPDVNDVKIGEPEVTPDETSATAEPTNNNQAIDQTSSPASDDDRTYEVKVDGQIMQVSEKELREGYMRQADYTRKTQEIGEMRRKAQMADRLLSDPRYNQEPKDRYTQTKEQLLSAMKSRWPQVEPAFLEMMLDAQTQIAELKATDSVKPFEQQYLQEKVDGFMSKHPDVVEDTQEYNKIVELVGKGVDMESAYRLVMYDKLKAKDIDAAIKARDEEAKRKLKQAKVTSSPGKTSGRKDIHEILDEKIALHGQDLF